MEAEELDRKFDQGEDISQHLDFSQAGRIVRDIKKE
jgi:hypothetical protein